MNNEDRSFADQWNAAIAEEAKLVEQRREQLIKNLESIAGLDGSGGCNDHGARVAALCRLWDITDDQIKTLEAKEAKK